MNDFKFMDDVVNKICKSMKEDPNRWLISTYTVEDTESGVDYWISDHKNIYSIWTGNTTERVFSNAQGKMIGKAFQELCSIKESQAQEKVIKSFKPKVIFALNPSKKKIKKWWEFWK